MENNMIEQAAALARDRRPENLAFELLLARDEIATLTYRNENQTTLMAQMHDEIVEARGQKVEAEDNQRNRERDLFDANVQLGELREQITAKDTIIANQRQQVQQQLFNFGQLQQQLQAGAGDIERLAEEKGAALAEMGRLRAEAADWDQDYQEERDFRVTEERAHRETHEKLTAEKEKSQDLRQSLRHAKKKNKQATQQVLDLSNELNRMGEELKSSKDAVQQYKSMMGSRKSRASWSVSPPPKKTTRARRSRPQKKTTEFNGFPDNLETTKKKIKPRRQKLQFDSD